MQPKMPAGFSPHTIHGLFFSNDGSIDLDGPSLVTRDGPSFSRREFVEKVRRLALGLIDMGIERGERVAMLAENSPEWIIFDLAISAIGAATVPIYPTLTAKEAAFITNDSGASMIMASPHQLDKASEVQKTVSSVKRVVNITSLDEISTDSGKDRLEARISQISERDIFSIIYTSGTTGRPKGARLTHRNFLSNILASNSVLNINLKDSYLSYLPLSHVFERMVHHLMISCGARIAYSAGFAYVGADAAFFKPTVMTGVPFFFERMKQKILEGVEKEGGIKKKAFETAIRSGLASNTKEKKGVAKLLDGAVLKKMREKVAPRVRFFVSGGAPLAKETADFFWALGFPVLEGYGLTETSPVLTVNTLEHAKTGTVGRPVPGVEIKIAGDGEILASGPNIMEGYHDMPDATTAVIKDGWFHTGDLGSMDADGFLTITDRKKDIIITTLGKNISPLRIETALKTDPDIKEALVYGNNRPHLAALIVPEPERLKALAARLKIDAREPLKNPALVAEFERKARERLKNFARFEQIRRLALIDDTLAEENDVTPTLKVKRERVGSRYKDLITGLYE